MYCLVTMRDVRCYLAFLDLSGFLKLVMCLCRTISSVSHWENIEVAVDPFRKGSTAKKVNHPACQHNAQILSTQHLRRRRHIHSPGTSTSSDSEVHI
jgi:hypothetical protein